MGILKIKILQGKDNGCVIFNNNLLKILRVDKKRCINKVAIEKARPTFVLFFRETQRNQTAFCTIGKNDVEVLRAASPISYAPSTDTYGTVPESPNVALLLHMLGKDVSTAEQICDVEPKRLKNGKTIYYLTPTDDGEFD
jgi:hypothetical protein